MEELSENIGVLHNFAESAGRNPQHLDVAMKTPLYDSSNSGDGQRRRFSGTNEEILQDIQSYSDVGTTHIIFDIRGGDLNQTLERLDWFASDIMANGA